jgi:hypothetical protein
MITVPENFAFEDSISLYSEHQSKAGQYELNLWQLISVNIKVKHCSGSCKMRTACMFEYTQQTLTPVYYEIYTEHLML